MNRCKHLIIPNASFYCTNTILLITFLLNIHHHCHHCLSTIQDTFGEEINQPSRFSDFLLYACRVSVIFISWGLVCLLISQRESYFSKQCQNSSRGYQINTRCRVWQLWKSTDNLEKQAVCTFHCESIIKDTLNTKILSHITLICSVICV